MILDRFQSASVDETKSTLDRISRGLDFMGCEMDPVRLLHQGCTSSTVPTDDSTRVVRAGGESLIAALTCSNSVSAPGSRDRPSDSNVEIIARYQRDRMTGV